MPMFEDEESTKADFDRFQGALARMDVILSKCAMGGIEDDIVTKMPRELLLLLLLSVVKARGLDENDVLKRKA